MKTEKETKLEIKLPQPDHKGLADRLTSIEGVEVDLHEGEGHYSPYGGKLITIGYHILFPMTITFPPKTLGQIQVVLEEYLENNHTAMAIQDASGTQIIVQGTLAPETKRDILSPLFKALAS